MNTSEVQNKMCFILLKEKAKEDNSMEETV
jgi:hypothetical protein